MAVRLRHFLIAAFAAFAPAAFAETAPTSIQPALFVARDADSTLYLYGTVHIRPTGAEWSDASVRAALDESEEVWTEMPIGPEAEAAMRAALPEIGYDPGKPLSSWLTPEQQAQFQVVTQRLGISAGALEPMRPWLAGLVLAQAPLVRAGFHPESGVDRAVDAYGEAAGKRMRSFETAREQLGFLAGLPDDLQREMLIQAIDESDKTLAEFSRLNAAWEMGDLGVLELLVVQELRVDYPHLYDVLIVRRNVAWIETLMQEIDGAGVDFVAVGAAHMVGEDGLVAQLRARGVRVERVSAAE